MLIHWSINWFAFYDFLSFCESTYDNKEFSHENLKPCFKSWIPTSQGKPCSLSESLVSCRSYWQFISLYKISEIPPKVDLTISIDPAFKVLCYLQPFKANFIPTFFNCCSKIAYYCSILKCWIIIIKQIFYWVLLILSCLNQRNLQNFLKNISKFWWSWKHGERKILLSFSNRFLLEKSECT